jgi:hypothetical protein
MAIVNIPGVLSPLDSFAKGFGLTDNLMKQILERKYLSQQQKQFEQELALKKQQEARMGANMGLNRAILQQRLNILKQKSDPNYELNRFNLLFGGGQSGNQMDGGQSGTAAPTQMSQEYPALDEMFSGRGAFPIPEEMPRTEPVQQRPAMGGAQVNNALLETLRNDPAKRALFKHMYKFDPLAPTAQTPEEKKELAIDQALSIDEAKANRKKIDEIEKTAQALIPFIVKAKTIKDILNRNPKLTGPSTALADMLGLSRDTDVGTFISAAQSLQGKMAHELGSRGGYGLATLVEKGKPNIGKSNEFNVGVTEEILESMHDSFLQMKQEYERLSNKPFPYNFEQYFEKATGTEKAKRANKKRVKFNLVTGRLE